MYNIVLKALKNITQRPAMWLTKPTQGRPSKFTIYSVHNILVEQRNTSKSHVKATKKGNHPQHSKYFKNICIGLLSICFGFDVVQCCCCCFSFFFCFLFCVLYYVCGFGVSLCVCIHVYTFSFYVRIQVRYSSLYYVAASAISYHSQFALSYCVLTKKLGTIENDAAPQLSYVCWLCRQLGAFSVSKLEPYCLFTDIVKSQATASKLLPSRSPSAVRYGIAELSGSIFHFHIACTMICAMQSNIITCWQYIKIVQLSSFRGDYSNLPVSNWRSNRIT